MAWRSAETILVDDLPLMINEEVVEYPIDQQYLTRRITEEAIAFMLAIDLGESNNLAGVYTEVAARLRQRMREFDADLNANARPIGRLAPGR